ncbi:imidazolonepropionase [Cellulomonas humilata]|uniref:Imidazolonepropionase n=1 Tax=Cellulomonas humilata TaxID=144055 RepID=A0A7Y5ZZH7_9CELL|nr:imidazolonepropionase [Cellulomonas humilata]NUU16095.1 imidazolonepropionase [Cellulomonas humilata]
MTSHLVTGIGELTTHDDRFGGPLLDAALVAQDGLVAWVGPAADAPAADTRTDLAGAAVVPGFVDSHTHLVFGGDRSAEFEARMAGTVYTGGGIATTVAATRASSDEVLRDRLAALVREARSQGTTTLEIKSGYGLDVENEVRLLRLAREVTPETTFLGAHVVPADVDRADYLALVTGPMLEACAPYARWADVFCEPASPLAFDGDEARAVLVAARAAGLGLRVHASQLAPGPGVHLAVELGAASVDHCTYLSNSDVAALAGSGTVATLLPGVEFSTRSPYPDARRIIEAGVEVALASDCNPGTCYSTSMPLMIALAVREMRMTVEEAVRAATLGGAHALRRDDVGHLRLGARADLAVLDAPSYRHLAYRPGVPIARALTL